MNKSKQASGHGMPPTPRRPVLKWIWTTFLALATLEAGWIITSIIRSTKESISQHVVDNIIDAGTVDQFTPGQVKAVPQGQFYLSCLEDGSFIALSRVCTHLGCVVPWDEKAQAFVCPCHGSTFDRKGLATKSPASRPLDYYPVKIENGLIKVNGSQPTRRSGFTSAQTARV